MSVAEDVRLYLKNRPYVLDNLEKGLVNTSQLSRMIGKELGIRKLYAIKGAVRRYSDQLSKSKRRREEGIMKVLKGSSLTLFDNASLLVTDKDIQVKKVASVSLGSKHIIIVNKDMFKEALRKNKRSIVNSQENCSVIVLNSPTDVQSIPGVAALQASILAEQNINVLEFFSCFEDTIIVVNRADALRTYEVLSGIVG